MIEDNKTFEIEITSPKIPSGDVSKLQPSITPNRKSLLRRAIRDFPGQTAQLASLPILVGCLAASSGIGAFQQLAHAFTTGNPIGAIALGGVSIYALLAAGSIAQMKEGIRAADHDRTQAANTTELAKKLDRSDRTREQQMLRDTKEITSALAELTDRIDRLTHEQMMRPIAGTRPQKNVAEVWSNLAEGSILVGVNGQCRLDVVSELQADGSLKLVPDYGRLVNWLKRYGPNGIARAELIIFTDDTFASDRPTQVTRQIALYLMAFRALKVLAAACTIRLNLNGVRFFLQNNAVAPQSFFIGTYGFAEKNVDFVISYCDFAAMFNVPKTLLDDEVEVQYAVDAIEKYRHLADTCKIGARILTIDELEGRYGHLVPQQPQLDPAFLLKNRLIHDFRTKDNTQDEMIVNGDHFVFVPKSH